MSDLVPAMAPGEARALTDEVRTDAERLYSKLLRLREGRAWDALGYDTWADYVRAEFDMTKRRANQLVAHAEVVREIEQVGTMVPTSERQARPLTRLRDDPAAVRSAWTRATDHAEAEQKPVTAAVVEQAVRDELAARREQSPASTPKARRAPRPALAEMAKEAGWDIRKLADRIDVLVHDERYPRNQEQVATALRGHLLHVIETATNVLDHLSDNTQEATS